MLAVNYSTIRSKLKDYCDKATDENMLITKEVSIDNTYVIVRRGKKKYYVGIIK